MVEFAAWKGTSTFRTKRLGSDFMQFWPWDKTPETRWETLDLAHLGEEEWFADVVLGGCATFVCCHWNSRRRVLYSAAEYLPARRRAGTGMIGSKEVAMGDAPNELAGPMLYLLSLG